jgi:hypothetical protein
MKIALARIAGNKEEPAPGSARNFCNDFSGCAACCRWLRHAQSVWWGSQLMANFVMEVSAKTLERDACKLFGRFRKEV